MESAKHRPKIEWNVVASIVLLLCVSLAGSAMFQYAFHYCYYFNYFYRLLFYIPVGIGILLCLYRLDYVLILRFARVLLGCGITLLVVALCTESGGPVIGKYSFDINQPVGVLCALGIAGMLQDSDGERAGRIAIKLFAAFIPIFLFWKLDQLLWAIVLCVVTTVAFVRLMRQGTFMFGKWTQRILLIAFILICGVFIIGFFAVDFGRQLAAWIDPAAYQDQHGFLNYRARMLISSAVPFGKSAIIPAGTMALSYTPYPSTDLALLTIFSTYGWVAGIAVTLLLCFFAFSLCRAAVKTRNTKGGLLTMVCAILIAIQLCAVLCTNFGYYFQGLHADVPFLSVGGLSLMGTMALSGVVLSVWRTRLEE